MAAFDSVLGIAVRAAAPPYAGLYERTCAHPGGGTNEAIYDPPLWELTG
jgi:hypothetical protein